MKHPFQRAPAWFAIALIIMSGTGALVYKTFSQADDVDRMVGQTREVIDTLSEVAAAAGNAERGAHAYVLTGDVRFLEPFHKGIERGSVLAEQLEKMVRDNPPQAVRARQLRTTLRENAELLRKQVTLRSDNGFDAAREQVARQTVAAGLGGTGSVLADMRIEEERLLADHTEQSSQARRLALLLGMLGALLNIIITGLVFEMLRRENNSRRKIQGELVDSNHKLSDSLERADLNAGRLAKTIENFPLGVLLTDADLRVIAFNDRLLDMIGAPAGAIRPGDELEKVWLFGLDEGQLSDDDRARLAQRRRNLVENPQTYRFERMHGNGRLVEARGTPLPGGGFIKVYTDITKQRAEARKLMEERNSAEEIARAKSEFLAVMSHEVRTPMNGVMGIAELLRDTPLTPEQRNYVDIIVRSGESLLTILNDILDLSKVEAGKVELESLPFNPQQVLRDMLALWSPRASEKGLSINLRLNSELPPVLNGDAGRLRQVISNLIGNAVKFTEQGGVIVDARLMAQDKDGVLISFSVTDTGIGINEEQRSRLFQPFSQADASTTRRFGGTGLGLAISQRLVEKMGGAIDVFSQEGHGSVFSFTARFLLGTEEEVKETAAVIAAEREASFTGRVLIVEDHPVNRAVARASLKRLGLEVLEAVNGRAGVDVFIREKVDLIFMDMHMPIMDGMEATRVIREAEEKSGLGGHVAIVAMTANVLPEAVGACISAGMDGFLCKPFARQQLIDVLDHWLPKGAAADSTPALTLDAPLELPAAQEPGQERLQERAEEHAQENAPPRPKAKSKSKAPLDEAVLDMNRYALLEDTMGEEMAELLGSFRDTSGDLIGSLQNACAGEQWDQAFRDAHTLASSAAMLGAARMSSIARKIETQAREGGSPEAVELAAQIGREFAMVDDALAALADADHQLI